MLSSLHTVWILASVPAQPLPDQLDILRGADTTPQIQLVLDTSGSMASGAAPTVCSHYPSAQPTMYGSYYSGGSWYLSRTDQLKAALTGCRTADDGILDLWSDRVVFSVREFGGSRTGLLEGFDPTLGNKTQLESAVMNLLASGGTPLAPAYRAAGGYFDSFFNDGNTASCRQNYVVLMSDGVGNSWGDVLFDFIPSQPDLTVRDANVCFGNFFSGCPAPPYPDEAAAYMLEDASGQTVDALSSVTGTQPIRTYTVGFQAPTAADALLRSMAARGDGLAYSATSYEQLSAAFAEIISTIVARSRVAFSGGSIEGDGLFSGNHVYLSVFRPLEDGHWAGSTKKFCVLPDGGRSDCLFREDASGTLVVNPRPVDVWSGSDRSEANAGGSGEVLLTQTFGVADTTAAVPSSPLTRRTLLTWRPGQAGYVAVHPSVLSPNDTWTSGTCAHHALVNSLHGFTKEVADCAAGDLAPAGFDQWPQGDTVHAGTVLLQYTPTCDGPSDVCYVATASNDGMLHFFDARNGVETSAIIPAEIWAPNGIARHRLNERSNQPALDTTRRYYFDGQLRLHHEDRDGDQLIDPGEPAFLVAGLGRGGRAYYRFDVDTFDGVPNATYNPPRPLFADEASGLSHLAETWAAPWIGDWYDVSSTSVQKVAVFPSGHLSELDAPDATFVSLPPAPPRASSDTRSHPHTVACTDVGLPADLCGTPDFVDHCADVGLTCSAGTSCSGCNDPDPKQCAGAGLAPPYCYDWPGWVALPPQNTAWSQHPVDVTAGPLVFQQGDREGLAYRVRFSRFDLQAGDYVAFLDTAQNEVGRLSGAQTSSTGVVTSPWIHDRGFSLRIVTDGDDASAAQGFQISGIDVIRSPEAVPGVLHAPSVYVVGLERWNQDDLSAPPYAAGEKGTFAAPPVGNDASQADAVRVRFTRECGTATLGSQEACIDRSTSPATADLQWMTCPISAEPSVYSEGGLVSAIYIGDECGQIWRFRVEADESWSATRLLRLNETDGSGATFPGRHSKDYRKIFTQLDLVISTCPGKRAVGVYFGTGNVQRPAADDALQDPDVTGTGNSVYGDGRDVVGVVWDSPTLPAGASLDDLANVTDTSRLNNTSTGPASHGWFIELDPNERMLRDPLVFDGLAYFDTYRPVTGPSECVSAAGAGRSLVADNCTAEGFGDRVNPLTPNDTRTASPRIDSTIGGGFAFVAPTSGRAFVTLGLDATTQASLPVRSDRRPVRLFLWRL